MNTENIRTALRNTKTSIEADQQAPLDLDQATIIHDLCVALDIMPLSVLDEALNLIEPAGPANSLLLDILDDQLRPRVKIISNPGRAT